MILDSLENAGCYTALSPAFAKAFAFLSSAEFPRLACGRYEIDGSKVYAVISEYETRPASEKHMEGHRRYLDIQYLAEGTEAIGCAKVKDLPLIQAYSQEKDILFVSCEKEVPIPMAPGDFMILFPQDGHRPGCFVGGASHVRKAVVKIALDCL